MHIHVPISPVIRRTLLGVMKYLVMRKLYDEQVLRVY